MSYTDYDFPHTHFYDTDLRELITMYTKITKEVGEIKKWKDEQYHDYKEILAKTATLEIEVNRCLAEISKQQQRIDEECAKCKKEVDLQFQRALNSFTNAFKTLSGEVLIKLNKMQLQLNDFNLYLINELAKNKNEIYEHVNDMFTDFIENLPDYENLIVYNPVRGEQTTIQIAINDLYSMYNFYGLTAMQYDSLSLTALQYDTYELTAKEYDTWGYIKLNYPDPRYYMVSPFTGVLTLIKDVVYQLAKFHMDGLQATEYDAKLLTANDYDAKLITAYNYDWFGKEILA